MFYMHLYLVEATLSIPSCHPSKKMHVISMSTQQCVLGALVLNSCGTAPEILSSLFRGLEAISTHASSHSSMALSPPRCSGRTPQGPSQPPLPQFLAWEPCVHKPYVMWAPPHCSFSPKGHWIPGLSPQGAGGGKGNQGLSAQANAPHLLTQDHSEGAWSCAPDLTI